MNHSPFRRSRLSKSAWSYEWRSPTHYLLACLAFTLNNQRAADLRHALGTPVTERQLP